VRHVPDACWPLVDVVVEPLPGLLVPGGRRAGLGGDRGTITPSSRSPARARNPNGQDAAPESATHRGAPAGPSGACPAMPLPPGGFPVDSGRVGQLSPEAWGSPRVQRPQQPMPQAPPRSFLASDGQLVQQRI
jgi:hypothetical protein